MEQKKEIVNQLELFNTNGEEVICPQPTSNDVPKAPVIKASVQVDTASEQKQALVCNLMEKVCSRNNLRMAYEQVKQRKGSPGTDEMPEKDFGEWFKEHGLQLVVSLKAGAYQPQPVRAVEIPLPQGGMRKAGIPAVVDRVIQQAIMQVITPIYKAEFGLDLKNIFDAANHNRIMYKLSTRIGDKTLLRLIRKYMQNEIITDEVESPRVESMPHGCPLSPLLPGTDSDGSDKELERPESPESRYVSYAVAKCHNIYVHSRKAGEKVMRSLIRKLQSYGVKQGERIRAGQKFLIKKALPPKEQSVESPMISYLAQFPDPQLERSNEHQTDDIFFIAVAAVICGAETWSDIELYGESKGNWLSQYLRLSNGIPSHGTLNRFFSALDPNAFEDYFLQWVRSVSELTEGANIDGKPFRGSRGIGDKQAIHSISAWVSANRLSLGQVRGNEKSNELVAIPQLLEILDLKGCIVTIDVAGYRREMAEKIVSKEADYILAVKGNQGSFEEDIERTVRYTKVFSEWGEEDLGRGRIESRHCCLYRNLSFIGNAYLWKSLSAVVKIESTRYIKSIDKTEKKVRFYITNSHASAEVIGKAVRSRLGIENSLHWQLDVSFSDDQALKREDYATQNFSIISRNALNLIQQEQSNQRTVKGKRLNAGWNNDYLLKILTN
jgi:predicted transposase YbfD/YdcC/retron-type reverse transcriptase